MIEIKNLYIEVPFAGSNKRLIDHVSLRIEPNSIFGLIGQSGSGKTTLALALTALLKRKIPHAHIRGEILYHEIDILRASPKQLRSLLGRKISVIFQNPFTYFNPSMTLESQFQEVLSPLPYSRIHEVLETVHLKDAGRMLKSYPHELSGGQLQRLMIALAILHSPEFLIADEPTTALDPHLRQEILNLMKELQTHHRLTLLIISHDVTSILPMCDRMAILEAGRLREISKELLAKGRTE